MATSNDRRRGKWVALILFLIANSCLAEQDWWLDVNLQHQLAVSIHRFAGNATGDYIVPNGLLASQIELGLGGPPNPAQSLSDGGRLLSASRPHSGDEKAAVVIDSNVNVQAAALISFGCHYVRGNNAGAIVSKSISRRKNSRSISCNPEPKLTIFRRENLDASARAALLEWAQSYSKDIHIEELRLK